MKVAILVVGELREVQKIKNAYDKCDVFVHTDKDYGAPFTAKYQYFTNTQKDFVETTFKKEDENFHRTIQWLRYRELLRNDLSDYDVIVKTRTDLDLDIDSIYNFLKTKEVKENTLYAMKDFIWYGTYDTIMKTDFFDYIMFYANRSTHYFPIPYDLILKCDLKCMEFQWLNWDKNIDLNNIKDDIVQKRDMLDKRNVDTIKISTHCINEQDIPFKSEKFFLQYLLSRNIVLKKLGFDLKFRNRSYG